jgi:hypothetical protein
LQPVGETADMRHRDQYQAALLFREESRKAIFVSHGALH